MYVKNQDLHACLAEATKCVIEQQGLIKELERLTEKPVISHKQEISNLNTLVLW